MDQCLTDPNRRPRVDACGLSRAFAAEEEDVNGGVAEAKGVKQGGEGVAGSNSSKSELYLFQSR